MTDFDTGIASVPAARPSVFTPPGTGTMFLGNSPTVDTGVGSTPAATVNVFDPVSRTVTADPGDVLAQ